MMATDISGDGCGAEPAPTESETPVHRKSQEVFEQQEQRQEEEQKVTALQDLIAGGVAGSASVVVGHPFDTYKVRLQTGGGGKASASARQFGGIGSLYRGMSAPLATAAVVNAAIFSSFGESSRYWDKYVDGKVAQKDEQISSEEQQTHAGTSLTKSLVCGSFAGAVQCLIICPMEHIKCRLQVQHGVGAADHLYRGPLDAVDKIVESHGIRGLFRGWCSTCWREIPAFGLYFATYDGIKERVNKLFEENGRQANSDEEYIPHHSHTWAASAFAGGVSGAFTWAIIYPIDVIKSRVQTAPLDCPRSDITMWNVGRKIVKDHGWRYMFRGLGVTLTRAFPVNGIIFPVYEFTLMKLTGEDIGGVSS
mmetsp:Transcript_35625/g.72895  ORF Transcript_35625/g.72895 Transcript_35625/m.72895 type:complete len:365 (-) Transcript_35625:41-1135(-)